MSKLDQLKALGAAKLARGNGPGFYGKGLVEILSSPNEVAPKPVKKRVGEPKNASGTATKSGGSPVPKRGRPRIGETRDQPWLAAGMSKTTWYRRKKEQK